MLKEFFLHLWATRVFFVLRLLVALVLCIVYILVAAAIQFYFVKWFGETTFNYIVGGVLSLGVGAWALYYLNKFIFMFIRGWHSGAMVYSKQIVKDDLPALEVGMAVFKKHFTSFALVYGAALAVDKLIDAASEKMWELLKDVPVVGTLRSFCKWRIIQRLGGDILQTAFDCTIFYIAKYTESGLKDDLPAVPRALQKYLYALPQIMLTSVGWFVFSWIIPKVLWFVCTMAVFTNGLVAGVLLNVLVYPLFYFLETILFEPLKTLMFVACYSKHCTEDPLEDPPYKDLVDSIIDMLGIDKIFGGIAGEGEDDTPTEESKGEKRRTSQKSGTAPKQEEVSYQEHKEEQHTAETFSSEDFENFFSEPPTRSSSSLGDIQIDDGDICAEEIPIAGTSSILAEESGKNQRRSRFDSPQGGTTFARKKKIQTVDISSTDESAAPAAKLAAAVAALSGSESSPKDLLAALGAYDEDDETLTGGRIDEF